jgi:hypothetical protein
MIASINISLRERAAARARIVPKVRVFDTTKVRVFDTTRPRAPFLLRLRKAVGPGGVLPAGVAGLAPLAKRALHAIRRQ